MTDFRLPVAAVTNDVGLEKHLVGINGSLTFTGVHWADSEEARIAQEIADEHCHAVCIGPDVPETLALNVSRALDQDHPEIGVVLLREPTADLWRVAARAGVRDIVEPGGIDTDLASALLAAAQRSAQLRATKATVKQPSRGKVIVVLSPKGGSGKTMLTTNLGVALATAQKKQTAIVDFDCVFGDVANAMGIVPEHTIGELATIPSFDSTTLKVYRSRHERTGL
jgi:pilus assembly protein CpaE